MSEQRHAAGARASGVFHPCRRAVAALATVAMVGAGCGAVQANRRAPGVVANGLFTPSKAPAAQYGPDAGLTCAQGGAFSILEADLAAAARKAGAPRPDADGRLCAAADTLLGWPGGESPPESVRRGLAWHFGLPSPLNSVVIATIDTEEQRVIAERVLEPAAGFVARAAAPRYGLATQRVRKGSTKVVLVMQDASVELEPTPRQVPAGGQVSVVGKLLGGYANPRVLACDPAGKLEAPPAQEGKVFQAELRCGDRPGRMQVEIRGERGGQLASLAKFPIACGSDLPAGVRMPSPDKGPVDPAAAARAVFDAMNAERTSVGLPALAWDESVAAVARDASAYLRAGASGAAQPPFDLVAALKKVDVASPLVLQNPVAATTVEEVNALVQTSPVDRSNVLNRQATHAGVGVTPHTTADGMKLLYTAELLVKELPTIDTAALRAQLRKAIARKRADARAAPASDDPLLDEIAQTYASELAKGRGEIPKARESAVVAPLYQHFRTVNILAGVKNDPMDFAEEPGVVAQAKSIGIGVAQGTSPSLGKNSTFAVVITGTRR